MIRHPDAGPQRRAVLASIAAGAVAAVLPARGADQPTRVAAAGLGASLPRADGPLKVSGRAPYAVEHRIEGLVHAVVAQSTVPAGRIATVDLEAARAVPGVVAAYAHGSGLRIAPAEVFSKGGAATENFLPLQDDRVRWNGQHVALVVAEIFEQATEAAALVRIEYEESPAVIDPEATGAGRTPLDQLSVAWGDAQAALDAAPVRVEGAYTTPREYNLPIEPHACIAAWEGDSLTVWEPSQWVAGARSIIADWMGIGVDKVRVVSPFVGGAFGCKVSPHPHVALACAAAREIGRPVKLALTRPQTFTGYGGRPRTHQRLSLGADGDGRLVSIVHEGWNETAIDDVHVEPCNAVTPIMYAVPNLASRHSLAPVNTVNPGWFRAPGENPSAFAIETAMDELAHALGMDPLELRLRNYAEFDQQAKLPWTTRRLREAYAAGAEAFGWSQRSHEPRSMREGRELIGWGMASGTYPVRRSAGDAEVVVKDDGSVEVRSAGIDMGTGTYTILAQAAAEVLTIPVDRIGVLLGDTDLPLAPLAGGSQLANLLVGAVVKAARAARERLLDLAANHPRSPLSGARANDLLLSEGHVRPARNASKGIHVGDLVRALGEGPLVARADTFKPGATEDDRRMTNQTFQRMIAPTDGGVSAHAWSAQFVEVRVDEDFGTVRVRRMVGAFDSGRVYNPRLARSQWMGGMVMGLGQALLEEGQVDPRTGRVMNANLADYLVAVNADVPKITTLSVGVPDFAATALGGKAVGELGIVGVAAAIGNAVFHATGRRVRDLPITLDKLIS
ncbi:xanthine dehydrogenase family protein molybdopterin-binding subunit [Methylobacterium sp. SI9]|uniref:xanthine dehydrogenase family protein molybdopterin-binding subunit n=1 Tax=Methylobacterium guangdongense TaxID=3138811 RepID=UPI00313DF1D9